ncbi:shikimate dehydrogenase [Qingshengfaniella alkalisoli]|uniref:Shikimate dehydrogenase (NADP(+)) n=1 Tax=Qingshengfaniella alkalisoli TaxID=2599296 RepID=A0A5B8IWE5_9RHOB|nr:shikimate dehydrogenase [Qingshengfaniella alkalisoli]QDY69984.1 shikimate dehydrogenase [Qingshengfaniella alkalisoli]
MSDDKIPLAGVIGYPITHSKSPVVHGHWLRQYGLAGHYVPMHVLPRDLRDCLVTLPRLGFVGVNVTIPHKEAALGLADRVSDRAALIGAANTLSFREDGSIHADNTDGYGFTQNIRDHAPDWSPVDAPVALFGAGGAARAVVVALLDLGVTEIRITNRTRSRATALQAEFGSKIKVTDWNAAQDIVAGAGTIINSTSLGMAGKSEFNIPLDKIRVGAIATDLVYTPLRTPFLEAAEAQGAKVIDGLGMLLHQAAPAFERWFGKRPEVTAELRDEVLKL